MLYSAVAMIGNVRVEALSNNAVTVSWNPLLLTGIVGYRVYYRPTSGSRKRQSVEQSVRVEGATLGSVTITGLQGGMQYQHSCQLPRFGWETPCFLSLPWPPTSLLNCYRIPRFIPGIVT